MFLLVLWSDLFCSCIKYLFETFLVFKINSLPIYIIAQKFGVSNGSWKSSFVVTGINYIIKYRVYIYIFIGSNFLIVNWYMYYWFNLCDLIIWFLVLQICDELFISCIERNDFSVVSTLPNTRPVLYYSFGCCLIFIQKLNAVQKSWPLFCRFHYDPVVISCRIEKLLLC